MEKYHAQYSIYANRAEFLRAFAAHACALVHYGAGKAADDGQNYPLAFIGAWLCFVATF